MTIITNSLRGEGFKIHQQNDFTCRYCGVDGTRSFDVWLTLTVDHLLPKGHPDRDNSDYMVTACSFCNTADNRYFTKYPKLKFDGMTPDELVEQRKPYVEKVRKNYQEFWESEVKPKAKQ